MRTAGHGPPAFSAAEDDPGPAAPARSRRGSRGCDRSVPAGRPTVVRSDPAASPGVQAADERGATAVEFALLLPVLLLMMFGILEYGLYLFTASALQDALSQAARFGITGRTVAGLDREAAIRAVFERQITGVLDPREVTFESLVYPDFDSIGRPEPFEDRNGNGVRDPGEPFDDVNGNGRWDADMGSPGAGGPDSVVLYRARYRWRPLTPVFRGLFPSGGLELTATIAVRNEPFPGERG